MAAPRPVSLSDKYLQQDGVVYLSGMQALVRLPLLQRERDRLAGLDTAGLVTGYRGSPIGGYGRELARVESLLAEHQVRFQPGLNEELAATACWGAQQIELFPGARHDGVFCIWYGKSPGLDRSTDAIKHAGTRALLRGIHEDFRAESGFISRAGVVAANLDQRVTFFGKKGALLVAFSTDLVLTGTWKYQAFFGDGGILNRHLHVNNNATLRGGWKAGASVLIESFGYDPELYADYGLAGDQPGEVLPFVGVPRLPNLDWVLSLRTPEFKRFSGNVQLLWGKDENFFEWSSADIAYVTVEADWRPTDQLRASLLYNLQQFVRRSDDRVSAMPARCPSISSAPSTAASRATRCSWTPTFWPRCAPAFWWPLPMTTASRAISPWTWQQRMKPASAWATAAFAPGRAKSCCAMIKISSAFSARVRMKRPHSAGYAQRAVLRLRRARHRQRLFSGRPFPGGRGAGDLWWRTVGRFEGVSHQSHGKK